MPDMKPEKNTFRQFEYTDQEPSDYYLRYTNKPIEISALVYYGELHPREGDLAALIFSICSLSQPNYHGNQRLGKFVGMDNKNSVNNAMTKLKKLGLLTTINIDGRKRLIIWNQNFRQLQYIHQITQKFIDEQKNPDRMEAFYKKIESVSEPYLSPMYSENSSLGYSESDAARYIRTEARTEVKSTSSFSNEKESRAAPDHALSSSNQSEQPTFVRRKIDIDDIPIEQDDACKTESAIPECKDDCETKPSVTENKNACKSAGRPSVPVNGNGRRHNVTLPRELDHDADELIVVWNNAGLQPVSSNTKTAVRRALKELMAGSFFSQYAEYKENPLYDRPFTKQEILTAIKNREKCAYDPNFRPLKEADKRGMRGLPMLIWLYNERQHKAGRSGFLRDFARKMVAAKLEEEMVDNIWPEQTDALKSLYVEHVLGNIKPKQWSAVDENNFRKAAIRLREFFTINRSRINHISSGGDGIFVRGQLLMESIMADRADNVQGITPGYLCSDTTFSRRLPNYLTDQRMIYGT
jgi:hypothetical protein